MNTYEETIRWYDSTEWKPNNMERVLITVGSSEEYYADIGQWNEAEKRWYIGSNNDQGGVPGAFIWSWATMPTPIKFS